MAITPELGSNESLLLEVPDIKVKDINFRLFLTNRRLILSENRMNGATSSDIPVPVIQSAVPGTGDAGEPLLNLILKAPDGSDRRMMLCFTRNRSGGDRSSERDKVMHEIERSMKGFDNGSPGSVAGRQRPLNRGFSPGMSQPHSGINPGPGSPPGNIFRPPPPPPPIVRNAGTPYGDKERRYNSGPASRTPPRSYDPFPNERVAPQYARPTGRIDSEGYGGQAGGNFAYSPPSKRKKRSAPKRKGFDAWNSGGGDYINTDSIPGAILGIIRSPEDTFQRTRRKELEEVIPVLLVSLAIFAFGNAFFLGLITSSLDPSAYPALSGLADAGTLIFIAIEMIIIGFIFVAVTGILLHFGAYYEGYDEDIHDSIRVAAYSTVPFAVGGIIPVFGIIIAPIWSVYLQYTGMRETFHMDSDQAIIAALIPATAFVILFIITVLLGEDNFSIFGGA